MRFVIFFLGLFSMIGQGAHATEVEPPLSSNRGPVLCVWSITVTQIAVAEKCFKGKDPEFVDTLKWSLGRMDAFILRNSKISVMALEARRRKLSNDVLKNMKADAAGVCVPGQPLLVFYPKTIPPRAEIEAATNKLLEINRRPEMNPCM
ncbi:hypothetical protein JJB09_05100 [Rhizobium sp. KVB221]|uniref:Uncharacterized protein n=1 Tax=Rhizobium setariae TaxID=2801340 RepID=A0A936YJM8_9HYPH|nr:hypothetical protein [Rhizobium setariae]MBL0371398.1 hypothetical protein [Rhizobium setariae]